MEITLCQQHRNLFTKIINPSLTQSLKCVKYIDVPTLNSSFGTLNSNCFSDYWSLKGFLPGGTPCDWARRSVKIPPPALNIVQQTAYRHQCGCRGACVKCRLLFAPLPLARKRNRDRAQWESEACGQFRTAPHRAASNWWWKSRQGNCSITRKVK